MRLEAEQATFETWHRDKYGWSPQKEGLTGYAGALETARWEA